MGKLRIFISSTIDDLQEERKTLAEFINKNRFWEATYAESFVARSESPREICLEEVRKSHIYIGIFKNRYGYIPKNDNPLGLSVVALEYKEAKKSQLPIFIFIDKNADNKENKLTDFLEEILDFDEGHWRREYSNINELIHFASEAINREVTRIYVGAINLKRKNEIKYIYQLPYFKNFKRGFRNE